MFDTLASCKWFSRTTSFRWVNFSHFSSVDSV